MKPFARFVQRLQGRTHTEKLAILDAKARRLKAEGRGKKKLKRLAALREFVSAAASIDRQIGERTATLAGTRRKAYTPGIRF